VIQTHTAAESRSRATIEALAKNPVVLEVTNVLRVEG
jgi:hypothetical protein